MQHKKNPQKNLEQFRFVFFQIGLVLSLSAVIVVMKWTNVSYLDIPTYSEERMEEEIIDIRNTFRKESEQPKKQIVKHKKRIDPSPDPDPKPRKRKQIIVIDDGFIGEPDDTTSWTSLGGDLEEPEPVRHFLVERKPVFPGCEHIADKREQEVCFDQAFQKFVLDNVRYPEIPKSMGVQGKVYVTFVIGSDGIVRDLVVERSVDKYLDAEAMRVVGKAPQMVPAKQRGRAVPVIMTLPINFRLN